MYQLEFMSSKVMFLNYTQFKKRTSHFHETSVTSHGDIYSEAYLRDKKHQDCICWSLMSVEQHNKLLPNLIKNKDREPRLGIVSFPVETAEDRIDLAPTTTDFCSPIV